MTILRETTYPDPYQRCRNRKMAARLAVTMARIQKVRRA